MYSMYSGFVVMCPFSKINLSGMFLFLFFSFPSLLRVACNTTSCFVGSVEVISTRYKNLLFVCSLKSLITLPVLVAIVLLPDLNPISCILHPSDPTSFSWHLSGKSFVRLTYFFPEPSSVTSATTRPP